MTETESLPRRAIEDLRSRDLDVRAVVISAFVAGGAFLVVEIVGQAARPGASPWDTPLQIASLVAGSDVQKTAATWPPGLFVLALVIHSMLSLTYAMMIALATMHMSRRVAAVSGALFGVALYFVNYHLIAPLLPEFEGGRGLITVVAHAVFGATAALVFRETRALRARAGAGGVSSRSTRPVA